MVSLEKVLDLLLLRPIQGLVLVPRCFSLSLSLWKVGILSCVGKGAVPLVGQLVGESAVVIFLVLFSLV
jgi:hypothetical protein